MPNATTIKKLHALKARGEALEQEVFFFNAELSAILSDLEGGASAPPKKKNKKTRDVLAKINSRRHLKIA